MKLKQPIVALMLAAMAHLCFLTPAWADPQSSKQSSTTEQSSKQSSTTEQSSKQSSQSTQQSSQQSSQQASQVSLVVGLVLLGLAVIAGGIVLTVVLARKPQRANLVSQSYRGDGQLLRLLARQNGLSLKQTAGIIRQANRESLKAKDRLAVLREKISTGLLAARFRVSTKAVKKLGQQVSRSRRSTCSKSQLLLTRLCALAKKKRTLPPKQLATQCASAHQKVKKMRICRVARKDKRG